MVRNIVLLLCLLGQVLEGLDYSPWFSKAFEFIPSLEYRFQYYPNIYGTDHFITAGLGMTLWDNWNGQAAVTAAETHTQRCVHANDVQVLLRYQLTNDAAGDSYSSAIGLTVIEASHAARRDLGVFYPGGINAEMHYGWGKEIAPHENWIMRGWGLGALGAGDAGAPWIRIEGAFENHLSIHWIHSAWIEGYWGLGHDRFLLGDFEGYGKLNYQSADVGWYTRYLAPEMDICLGIAYRILARNCPRTMQIRLSAIFPFGL